MKTDQKMIVQLGEATVTIHHKTMIGSLNEILAIGNSFRLKKGQRKLELKEYLSRETTWELIQATEKRVHQDNDNSENLAIINFKNFMRNNGQLEYSKLIPKFKVIKTKRGKGGGTWGHLYIMLDLATTLDADFKVLVFETFVKSKILEWRDIGGDNYILLNKIIDTLPDRQGKNNHGVYIQIAKQFRQKLELIDSKGYNVKEAIAEIQQKRANWEDKLVSMIEVELITSYPQLKDILTKLK